MTKFTNTAKTANIAKRITALLLAGLTWHTITVLSSEPTTLDLLSGVLNILLFIYFMSVFSLGSWHIIKATKSFVK